MKTSLTKLILFGVVLEMLIFMASYFLHTDLEETFRYAARYSGRLSFVVFVYTFYLFASAVPKPITENVPLKNFLTLFAVLHVIHLGFLWMSVYLNEIPLETVKLMGGALAYLMIILAPFFIHRLKLRFQLIYFYYVSLVMALTFVARFKGELQGADPYWFHYVGLGVMALCCVVFGFWIRKSYKGALSGG